MVSQLLQKPFRDDSTFDETQNYNCTDTQMDVSAATQLVGTSGKATQSGVPGLDCQ